MAAFAITRAALWRTLSVTCCGGYGEGFGRLSFCQQLRAVLGRRPSVRQSHVISREIVAPSNDRQAFVHVTNGRARRSMTNAAYSTLQNLTFFRPPTLEDLQRISDIEAESYPADEAATYEKLEYRIQNACGQFLVAVQSGTQDDQIVGYCCGTCSHGTSLSHESMSTHEPGGQLLCIHSVAVGQQHRRQGVARRLLKAYLAYVQGTTANLKEVRLICKENLVPLYQKAGFALLGPSSVVHGQDQWLEMMWRPDIEQR